MSRASTQILTGIVGLAGLVGGLATASPSLDACLAECKRSQLSMTNRATCRLDCEMDAASDPEQIRARIEPLRPNAGTPATPGAGGTRPAPASGPANGPGCKSACEADTTLSVDDRATCKLECDLEPAPMPTGTPPPMRPPKLGPAPATTPATTPMPGPTRGAGLTWTSTRPGSAPASASTQAGFLVRCQATCKQGPGAREATDFETCKLDCETMASVLDVAANFVPDAWLATPRPIATRDPTPVPMPVPTPTPTPGKVITATEPTPSSTPDADTCAAALERCNTRCTKGEAACRKACGRKHAIETDRESCKLDCGTELEVCKGDCLTENAICVNSRRGR